MSGTVHAVRQDAGAQAPEFHPGMNCDRIAGSYRWIERAVFGRTLERVRMEFLNDERVQSTQQALVLGDGDGRFLKALLDENHTLHAEYLDLSAKMLDQTRAAAGSTRVRYRQEDVLQAEFPERSFGLITTHFLLDCFDWRGIARVAEQVQRAAAPGAVWIVSEFREPSGWTGLPARALIAIMYRFFAVMTGLQTQRMTDHRPILHAAGFRLERERLWLGGLVASELWAGPE